MSSELLKRFDKVPEGFLKVTPNEVLKLLGSPTLLQLKGEKSPPLFVSILLHGNETSSLPIIQSVLRKYESKPLPRDLIVFIGNVFAAEKGLRTLDCTPDYNRIWKGGTIPECAMASEVIEVAKKAKVKVAIDIHNNSGKNPVYGCIRDLDPKHKHLAKLFSPLSMHSPLPVETLSNVFSDFCAAITCECGLPGSTEGIKMGIEFVERCLEEEIDQIRGYPQTLYDAKARIHVPKNIPIHFSHRADLPGFTFPPNFDAWNFMPLLKGHVFGYRSEQQMELVLLDEDKTVLPNDYFWYRGHEIIVEKPFTPAMLTMNIPIVYQDCLGYAMESLV